MNDHVVFHKFPEGSDRDYDIFEELPDRTTSERVFGMEAVESKLVELAQGSINKFFALNLKQRNLLVVRPRSSNMKLKSATG